MRDSHGGMALNSYDLEKEREEEMGQVVMFKRGMGRAGSEWQTGWQAYDGQTMILSKIGRRE